MTTEEHNKIMEKADIKVCFKDRKKDIIPAYLWDDYEYVDRLFVVKRKGVWIAIYNMDCIDCITIG